MHLGHLVVWLFPIIMAVSNCSGQETGVRLISQQRNQFLLCLQPLCGDINGSVNGSVLGWITWQWLPFLNLTLPRPPPYAHVAMLSHLL